MSRMALATLCGVLFFACQFPRPPDVALEVDAAESQQFTVRVTVEGTGAGEVVVSPGDWRCIGGVCEFVVERGSQISIDAVLQTQLDVVSVVSGHCGALPCALTVNGDVAVRVGLRRMSCVPMARSCDGGAYSECGSDGEYVSHEIPNGGGEGVPSRLVMNGYRCPLRCHETLPACTDIDVAGLNSAMDLPEVSGVGMDVVLPLPGSPPGIMSIDTTSQFENGYINMGSPPGLVGEQRGVASPAATGARAA